MPLIRPQLPEKNPYHDVMKDVLRENRSEKGSTRAKQALEENGLTIEEIAEQMGYLLRGTQDDSIKMKVIDTSLKVHGALEPEKTGGNNIQIVFQFDGTSTGVADILLPR